ncbi:carotenoid ester lipase precursor [Mycena pura]|uniref:Carotenoid ester lipase n=1 Tax=Mycena pura TaxID=153505 RepID=A0AAD6USH4_9AGAR|nr:carotenoid ester lipase precursor [Mycena pura]
MVSSSAFLVLLLQLALSIATLQAPTVQLDRATVTGFTDGALKKFLGIPYVRPPVGPLRLRLPQPISSYEQHFVATAYGPICPQMQQTLVLPKDVPEIVREEMGNIGAPIPLNQSEDCLTVNVIAPADATPQSKLPVLVARGFEIGYPSSTDGSIIVNQSVALGSPIVYVSLNYRLNGGSSSTRPRTVIFTCLVFGFLGSKEVKEAGLGNLGLRDREITASMTRKFLKNFAEREAMRWVQRWGESAGAISVASHLLTNGGNNEGLFRAAIMDSGAPLWVGDITHGQPYYDFIVQHTGCSRAPDTLDCLRKAPFDTLMRATNSTPDMFSYQSLAESFVVRVDGVFLTDNPQQLVKRGSVSKVPFINGVNDDEGTLFSFTALNITTNDQLVDYWQKFYVPGASRAEIESVFAFYPEDPAAGSPFDTGDENVLTPQFKRYAAIMGDLVFHGPHRFFMQHRAALQPTWAYLYKRGKALPYLGAFHSTELTNAYGGGDLGAHFIRFASTLNPSSNSSGDIAWPRYTTNSPQTLTFLDGDVPLTMTNDDYRVEAIKAVTDLMLKFPY